MSPVGPIDRRGALTAGVAGALGITTTVLPAASAAATGATPQVSAPSDPVTAASVAGGVVSITLAEQSVTGSHSYTVWRNTATPGSDGDASELNAAVTPGVSTLSIGDATPLDEQQSHVIRVTHTNDAGSATSTLTLTPRSTTSAASSAATIAVTTAGFGPSAVSFTLTGGGGGGGGADGVFTGGTGGGGAVVTGSLAVTDGDSVRVHAGGGGGEG